MESVSVRPTGLTGFLPPRRLDVAVAASLAASEPATASLTSAVTDRVRYLRTRGAPPERVVIAIKRATFEAIERALVQISAGAGDESEFDDTSRAVVTQAVTAAVKAYYGDHD
jgi:hypothetical protein